MADNEVPPPDAHNTETKPTPRDPVDDTTTSQHELRIGRTTLRYTATTPVAIWPKAKTPVAICPTAMNPWASWPASKKRTL